MCRFWAKRALVPWAITKSLPSRTQSFAMAEPAEVIFEFYQVGAYVKVSAIDPATALEVAIVGDPAVGEEALKRTALAKLRYRLRRQAGSEGQAGKRAPGDPSKGVLV